MKRGMIVVSAVLTMSLFAQTLELGDQWEASKEYQEYVKFGGEKSEQAKTIKEQKIKELVAPIMVQIINDYDPKYREMMKQKLSEPQMQLGLQTLMVNIYLKTTESITPNHTAEEKNTFATYLYQYVKSIRDDSGACISNLEKIKNLYPELAKTEVIKFLEEIGKNYDEAAKNRDEAVKNRDEAVKWRKITEILKQL
ncbi:MAG: hypothetical protein WC691_09445 [Sulfuricurvum sp.]|jgi:hypothetical protein